MKILLSLISSAGQSLIQLQQYLFKPCISVIWSISSILAYSWNWWNHRKNKKVRRGKVRKSLISQLKVTEKRRSGAGKIRVQPPKYSSAESAPIAVGVPHQKILIELTKDYDFLISTRVTFCVTPDFENHCSRAGGCFELILCASLSFRAGIQFRCSYANNFLSKFLFYSSCTTLFWDNRRKNDGKTAQVN